MVSSWRPRAHALMILVLVCIGFLIFPLQAFSTGKLSSRRVIGRRGTSTTCTYAMFQDDDCEDLCDAFGEESSTPTLNKVKEVAKITSQRKPRHTPRALWETEKGPSKCKPCHGSGHQTCRFCGGTDFLSAIGGQTDALFYEGIGKDCPVCDDGLESCNECAGTGFFFSWSEQMNSLHP